MPAPPGQRRVSSLRYEPHRLITSPSRNYPPTQRRTLHTATVRAALIVDRRRSSSASVKATAAASERSAPEQGYGRKFVQVHDLVTMSRDESRCPGRMPLRPRLKERRSMKLFRT